MTQTKTTKRRGGGGKLTRTEQVSIRLDPKLRFAAELAASKERRTLSSFIEWAVERAVEEIGVTHGQDGVRRTAAGVATTVWDVDAPDRFVKLATQFPELLTHDEQRKWKFVRETDEFWEPETAEDDSGNFLGFVPGSRMPNMPVIRLAWDLIGVHVDEGEPFDWGLFIIRLNEAYPKVQVHHYSDAKRFKVAFEHWAGRLLETEQDPKAIASIKRARAELRSISNGA